MNFEYSKYMRKGKVARVVRFWNFLSPLQFSFIIISHCPLPL